MPVLTLNLNNKGFSVTAGLIPGQWTWLQYTLHSLWRSGSGALLLCCCIFNCNYGDDYFDGRIEKIEFLDEHELLVQLLQHYCLSCGYNDSSSLGQ